MKKNIYINTTDNIRISATIFSPATAVKASILINSATAVRQSYYQDFASFLCQQGYRVVTYDYRGIGDSSIANSRDPRLTMQNWGEKDFAEVLAYLQNEYPESDWHCIGHSVGGQIIGLANNNLAIKSVYCVSAQSGYWKHWQSLHKLRMLLMWHLIIPSLANLLGKVPGLFLGGESLPAGIAKQWATGADIKTILLILKANRSEIISTN